MAAEIKGQKDWRDYGLDDLRHVPKELNRVAPEEIKRADSIEDAIAVVADVFGLGAEEKEATISTKIGDIVISYSNLEHIVEKRQDARERYTHYALDTVLNPYEIWKTKYLNGQGKEESRYIFISLYDSKRQIHVIVSIWDQNVLWNFMHSDKKNLNKHRHGELIYQLK
ncbi:PBECR2 nuclease fold domain-containing protein [Photobacterium damselae]|uniref:PBECR2 nuclease fold domain-containing protein n=1 Tax=Photobacterium damselae TaxID=38293 RepID=UPI000D15DAF2|nr:PBECR2 nuclease fold domain-containing protein [Photobacterium damselae]PSV59584.1 hypothetical protein CTT35_15315 [Photobacterium damselae]PSW76278.1 hypothetical protein CTT37_15260 [Photobacterium damselae]